jgi:pimeloyl-ACP methyl ester carboxylesterase
MRLTLTTLTASCGCLMAVACAADPAEDALAEPVWIEAQQLPVGGLTFDALVAGPDDGELVLLLHGFPQTSHAWRDQLLVLGEAGYLAVAPDQRGYSPGARPPQVDDYALNRLHGDVLGFADALGRERFHLVGHDWGAILAWTTAAWTPERLLSVTAVSVPHPDPYIAAQRDPGSCQYEASAYYEATQTAGYETALLANGAAGLRSVYADLPDESVDQYIETLGTPEALGAALNWYRANTDGRVFVGGGSSFGAITVDTLFIYSNEDPFLCEEPKVATSGLVSANYRDELLDGVDHWIPEREPQRVSQLLLEHLATTAEDR